MYNIALQEYCHRTFGPNWTHLSVEKTKPRWAGGQENRSPGKQAAGGRDWLQSGLRAALGCFLNGIFVLFVDRLVFGVALNGVGVSCTWCRKPSMAASL